jgi:hypothetical protein
MKTALMSDSAMSTQSRAVDAGLGAEPRFFALSKALAQLRRNLADSFSAAGLAEGGDTEGAADLIARSRASSS